MLAEPGNEHYMKMFHNWEQEWNAQSNTRTSQIRIFYGSDEKLGRQIYAGCDIFLLPSKEEPTGIHQFIAMHYGAMLIIHGTGILRDSVIPCQPEKKVRPEFSILVNSRYLTY